MNIKAKTTLIIIITLIIGIVLGALLNRAFMHLRIRRAFDTVNPSRFMVMLERAIGPNPDQKKLVKEILQKHAKDVAELRKNLSDGMQSSFASMRKDLDSVLTSEQKERLEKMMKDRRPWMRRNRRSLPRRDGPFLRPQRKLLPDKKLPQNF